MIYTVIPYILKRDFARRKGHIDYEQCYYFSGRRGNENEILAA